MLPSDPPAPDTITWETYHDEILQAPVLTGASPAIIILPNRPQFCFDKQISVKMTASASSVNKCLYLDTEGGLVGHLKPQTITANLCDIKPSENYFSFFVLGLKGNGYHYYTREQNGQLKRYVSTGNTDEYRIQTPATNQTGILNAKMETRMYCNGKILGHAYKFDGSAITFYIFGHSYPTNLIWKKYIGNFGVGYLHTDKGLYMIMEMDAGSSSFRINSAEDVNICFDPTPFEIIEEKLVTKVTADIQQQQQSLDRQEENLDEGHCQIERAALLAHKRQTLEKATQNLNQTQQGNTYQSTTAQKGMLGLMDPMFMIDDAILQNKVNYCLAVHAVAEHPQDMEIHEKMICYATLGPQLEQCRQQMLDIDTQFSNSPAKAQAEKGKLYWEMMKHTCR